jgi:hypothetical protein
MGFESDFYYPNYKDYAVTVDSQIIGNKDIELYFLSQISKVAGKNWPLIL